VRIKILITLWTLFLFIGANSLLANPSLVKDINPGITHGVARVLGDINGKLILVCIPDVYYVLCESDGKESGTVVTMPGENLRLQPSGVFSSIDIGETIYFNGYDPNTIATAGGSQLWKTNGHNTDTVMVKANIIPTEFTEVNGKVFFVNGEELWVTDGSESGTVMVKDIKPTSGSSKVTGLRNGGGLLYFQADDGVHGVEPWISDGSESGTLMLKDIAPGSASSNPVGFTEFKGKVYFRARDTSVVTSGDEMWVTGGSEANTVLFKDINPGSGDSSPGNFTVVNETMFFVANDGQYGAELWKSDGTDGGTKMVKDIRTIDAVGGNPFFLTKLNDMLIFTADDGVNQREVWKSDGSESGTMIIRDIATKCCIAPSPPTTLSGVAYFQMSNNVDGIELWRTDGSETGTYMVMDINPGPGDSLPGSYTFIDGTLFFTANDGSTGFELWALTGLPVVNSNTGGSGGSNNTGGSGKPPGDSGSGGGGGSDWILILLLLSLPLLAIRRYAVKRL